MNFKRLLLFLIAPLALVMNSCTEEGPDYSLPTIAITDTEGHAIKEISFDAAGGTQKFVITSTRSWSINSTADWLVFNPTKHDNASLLEMACEVEVTAGPNDGIARSEAITITMDKKTETLTILQADKDGNNATLNGATPITVAEFLQKQEGDETIYQLTGTIGGSINTQYGNFDLTDATGTVYIYGLKDADDKTIDWAATNLAGGDIITVQGKFYLYNDKVEMKDALYISHEKGEAPAPKEGPYASDAAFVCEYDNSSEAAYGLGATKLGDYDATGFKLGKTKQEGKFTSAAVGVEGNKYLNFYAVSWGAGGDKTIYYRVKGGEIKSQAIKANTGAAGNAPYNSIVVAASDHYSIQLTGLKATDVIEFSTNEAFDSAELAEGTYATRAIFFGVKLSDEPIEAVEGGNTGGGSADVVKATVAEFLTTTDENTVYELTGEITGTYNTEYGNFYLKDATGEVVIYGLYKDGQKCYTSLGLKDGDTITVQGKHSVYNDKVQMKNAEYISHTAGEGGGTEEPEPTAPVKATVAEFLNAAEDATIYELTGTIKGTYNTTYGNFYLEDATGEVVIYGLYKDGEKCYTALGLKDGDTITVQGKHSVYNGDVQMKNAEYISHVATEGGDDNTGNEGGDPETPTTGAIELPWLENFNSSDLSKYTVVNGGSDTKVYPDDKLAGGEAGELLISKNNGSLTATIASDGSAKTLYFWFKTNNADRVTVSSATSGVTINKISGVSYTIELAAGVEVFALTLTNTQSSNVRVDDIVLTAETPAVESINVSGAQLLFTVGGTFTTGDNFTVTAVFQNGATENVTTNATVDSSEVDMTTAGIYTVTVSYNNITTTYSVTVQAAGVETITTSFVFKDLGYANSDSVESVTKDGVTISFAQGTNTNNSAKYYTTGEGVRTYIGNTITVSCDSNINSIEFTFAGDSYNKIAADGYSGTSWSGSAKEVVFDSTGTTRIQSITVTYTK